MAKLNNSFTKRWSFSHMNQPGYQQQDIGKYCDLNMKSSSLIGSRALILVHKQCAG